MPNPTSTNAYDAADWYDVLAYRNQLVATRNSQLEYQQHMMQLHTKIRQACRDLTKKDNSVKEEVETLSLEKGRLAYLRDELARRAEMLARWETRVRESDPNLKKPEEKIESSTKKEQDRMNAALVEMEVKRMMQEARKAAATAAAREAARIELSTPENEESVDEPVSPRRALSQQQFPRLVIGSGKQGEPVTIAAGTDEQMSECVVKDRGNMKDELVGTEPIQASPEPVLLIPLKPRMECDAPILQSRRSSSSSLSAAVPPIPDYVVEERPLQKPPRPYRQSHSEEDKANCLDYLWNKYSTEISEAEIGRKAERLMTLPNMMRLCGDACDFGISTQAVIDLYLRTAKLGKTRNNLVEKKYFYALLSAIVQVSRGLTEKDQISEVAFSEFLSPLMHRLRMMERSLSSKHPQLP
jgi:hypothetical protein